MNFRISFRGALLVQIIIIHAFFILISVPVQARIIPLFSDEVPAAIHSNFEQGVNQASSIYVWQNDPDLSAYSEGRTGITRLCLPSAISNALVYQFAKRSPRASQLQIPGIMPDQKHIDTGALVKYFAKKCVAQDHVTYDAWRATQCIHDFYEESGYQNSSVKLIRNYGDLTPGPGIGYENRQPTIEDLYGAISAGYQVIASIAFMSWNGVTWKKVASHAVNVVGYARNPSDENQKLLIYVQNPSREYEMNFHDAIFDSATLQVNPDLAVMPGQYSNIEVQGSDRSLLNIKGNKTFLAGLILIKPD